MCQILTFVINVNIWNLEKDCIYKQQYMSYVLTQETGQVLNVPNNDVRVTCEHRNWKMYCMGQIMTFV